MQSISFRDVLASEGVSLAGRYSFYRDLKAKYLNLIPIFGYIASVYCLVSLLFGLEPLYSKGSPVYYMAIAVFVIMIIRQIFRGVALYRVYGFRSMFFGCLLPPLFPIRLIYGNIINFTATARAFLMKLFGDKATEKKVNREHREKAKKPVKWAKTDHDFLSQEQLRKYRRMLGDTLITQGCLSAKTFQEALVHVDKQHGEKIGTYLIRKGIATEEQVVRALSHVKHIQFVPDTVVRKLDYEQTLANYDREKLARMKLLPLTVENDICIVGICNETRDDDLSQFESEYGLKIRRMYLMESAIKEALQSELLHAGEENRQPLDSLSLYHAGLIQYEQVVLIGIYSLLLDKAEAETRKNMGILAHQPSNQQRIF
jgi:adsorption protein B